MTQVDGPADAAQLAVLRAGAARDKSRRGVIPPLRLRHRLRVKISDVRALVARS